MLDCSKFLSNFQSSSSHHINPFWYITFEIKKGPTAH
jgi:hypothetical protein